MPSWGTARRTSATMRGGKHREARVVGAAGQVVGERHADAVEVREVPVRLRRDLLADAPHRVRDVADDLDLREVDRVDLGGEEVQVDDRRLRAVHHERRLLDDVVAHVDDAVAGLDGAVHEVAGRERGRAQPERVRLVDDALAHLRAEKGQTGAVDERAEHARRELAVRAGADHHEGALRVLDRLDGARDRLLVGHGPAVVARGNRLGQAELARDVLGQLEVDGAGPLLLRDAERLAHAARDRVGGDDRARVLRERAHHVHDVDDLEVPLLARLDRLLPGDHEHRHPAELRVGGRGHEVGGAGSERRQAHARAPGEASPRRGHEAGGLLVARDDEPDVGRAEGLEEIQVLFARQAEDARDALGREALHEEVGGLRHGATIGRLHGRGSSGSAGPRRWLRTASRCAVSTVRPRGVGPRAPWRAPAGAGSGGEQGIRTLGTLTGTPDFESGSFGHSDSSPPRKVQKPFDLVKSC